MAHFSRFRSNPASDTDVKNEDRSLVNETIKTFAPLTTQQSYLGDVLKLFQTNEVPVVVEKPSELASDAEVVDTVLAAAETADDICESIVQTVIETLQQETPHKHELMDGTIVEMSLEDAKAIQCVHDELNEDSQNKLKVLLTDNEESYRLALSFCEWYMN